MRRGEIVVISTTNGRALGERVCVTLSGLMNREISPMQSGLDGFNNGEVRFKGTKDIRGKDVYLIASLDPNDKSMYETVGLGRGAKLASADIVTLVVPHFIYDRADRSDLPRIPIMGRVLADMLLLSHCQHILLIDPHSDQIQMAFDVRGVSIDTLYSSWLVIPYIRQNILPNEGPLDTMVAGSPDVGGAARARKHGQFLGFSQSALATFSKFRPEPGVVDDEQFTLNGDVSGKTLFLFDDKIDTAGTAIGAANKGFREGAKDVYLIATHGIFSNDAVEKIRDSRIKQTIITDTVPLREGLTEQDLAEARITVLPSHELLARAIWGMHTETSLDNLRNPPSV